MAQASGWAWPSPGASSTPWAPGSTWRTPPAGASPLSSACAGHPSTARWPAWTPDVARVLVVDDEEAIVRALSANLKARGYDVDLAATGEQGLDLAARRHPDAVILDLGLPGMDGTEVIRGLRGWSHIPIIILSARSDEAEKVAALDAGA